MFSIAAMILSGGYFSKLIPQFQKCTSKKVNNTNWMAGNCFLSSIASFKLLYWLTS